MSIEGGGNACDPQVAAYGGRPYDDEQVAQHFYRSNSILHQEKKQYDQKLKQLKDKLQYRRQESIEDEERNNREPQKTIMDFAGLGTFDNTLVNE